MRQTYAPHEDTGPDIDHIPAIRSPRSTRLRDVVVTAGYPETAIDAAIPTEMTVGQLQDAILRLVETEPDLTHFTIQASVVR